MPVGGVVGAAAGVGRVRDAGEGRVYVADTVRRRGGGQRWWGAAGAYGAYNNCYDADGDYIGGGYYGY